MKTLGYLLFGMGVSLASGAFGLEGEQAIMAGVGGVLTFFGAFILGSDQ